MESMSIDDYNRMMQTQFGSYTISQPQMMPQFPQQQYFTVPQQFMMPQQFQPPTQQQECPTVTPVAAPKPLKPGQANDLPAGTGEYLTGKKVSIKDVIDKNMVVKGYRTMPSKFKHPNSDKCNIYQFSFVSSREENIDDLSNNIFVSGSKVLADQIEKYKEYIPFYTRIEHVNKKYYSFEQANFDDPPT